MKNKEAFRIWSRRILPVVFILLPILAAWILLSLIPQGRFIQNQLLDVISEILSVVLTFSLIALVFVLPLILGYLARVILQYIDVALYYEGGTYRETTMHMHWLVVWLSAGSWSVIVCLAEYFLFLAAEKMQASRTWLVEWVFHYRLLNSSRLVGCWLPPWLASWHFSPGVPGTSDLITDSRCVAGYPTRGVPPQYIRGTMLHVAMKLSPKKTLPELVDDSLTLEVPPTPATPPHKMRIILGGVVGLLAGVIFLVAIVFATKNHSPQITDPSTEPSPTPAPERTERNYLLMGYGGGGHAGGKLTDTMIIVAIRPENKRITLISLPRDLWVPLPISQPPSWWKLNAAYAIGSDDKNYRNKPAEYTGPQGGGALASKVVSEFANLQIDGYVTVNFATFISTVNLVNGISVPVERTFDDYQYPIEGEENNTCGKSPEELLAIEATASAEQAEKLFGCRYEHLHFDKGIQQMDGESALKYARSRHSAQDGNDFGRSERQKRVIIALKDKLLTVQFLPKLPSFVADLIGKVETNLGLNDALEFLAKKDEYSSYEIRSLAITDKNVLHSGRSSSGQYVLQPRAGEGNWSELQQFIQDGLYATASSQLEPAQTASPSAKI